MKEDRFMQICRNGIMKKLSKTPEQLIAEVVTKKVNGVGIIPALAMVAGEAIPVLMKLINALPSLRSSGKKKPVESLSESDFPFRGRS